MNTQHYKHESLAGLSSTNLIYDKAALETALEGHDNIEEILAVLGSSIDRDDSGFRNIDKAPKVDHDGSDGYQVSSIEGSDHGQQTDSPLTQLIADDTGTSHIMDHCQFYLGEIRAWRNGWNPKAYKRHAKATAKAQGDNGVVWGDFSMVPTEEERAAKRERIAKAKADIQAKKEKKLVKLAKRFG